MVWGIGLMGLSGLSMAIVSLSPGGSRAAASLVLATPSAVETNAARLGTGIGGALMVGWAVTLLLLLRSTQVAGGQAPEERLRHLGQAIFFGIASWFAIDSAVSIALGGTLNVVFNMIYLAAIGGPAWGLGRTISC